MDPYQRVKELPQSPVSQVLFRAALQLDERYLAIVATGTSTDSVRL